ncbi:MRG-domain-containing protein [Atractiella rhizophila]|nr:MRG-domain-containing protein [Atractiella rhizophila]
MVHTEFIEGERVLCYHGPLLYEAKILKISNDAPEALETNPGSEPPFYFVHYKGWKQSWDEWITNTRLLKLTTENIAAQKQLKEVQKQRDAAEQQALQAAQRGGEAKPSIPGKRGPVVDSRGTKRGRESTAQMGISDQRRALERGYPEDYIRPQIYIAIPDTLKVRLVDDWEWITHRKQVVPLPRKPNVRDILAKYRRSLIDDKNPLHNPHTAQRPVNLTHEFLAGLQLYFDKSLGTNLLYKFERLQYSNQKQITSGPGSGDAQMSGIYGAEHLLRLFVNLPEMMSHTRMDNESILILQEYITDFLRWMTREEQYLFIKEYQETSGQYQNQAPC